jgi:hypothetical protein
MMDPDDTPPRERVDAAVRQHVARDPARFAAVDPAQVLGNAPGRQDGDRGRGRDQDQARHPRTRSNSPAGDDHAPAPPAQQPAAPQPPPVPQPIVWQPDAQQPPARQPAAPQPIVWQPDGQQAPAASQQAMANRAARFAPQLRDLRQEEAAAQQEQERLRPKFERARRRGCYGRGSYRKHQRDPGYRNIRDFDRFVETVIDAAARADQVHLTDRGGTVEVRIRLENLDLGPYNDVVPQFQRGPQHSIVGEFANDGRASDGIAVFHVGPGG